MLFRLRLLPSVCVIAVLLSALALAQPTHNRAKAPKGPLSNGLGFAPAVPYYSGGNGANAVAIADVNGDGNLDVVLANWCFDTSCTSGSVGVLLGNGDGTFQAAVHYPSGGTFTDFVTVADLNGDGHPDIVVANCGSNSQANCLSTGNSGNVAVLLNNGDGTFAAAVAYAVGSPVGANGASSVTAVDVNGDGSPDLIVATGARTGGFVGVLLNKNDGSGTFNAELTPEASGGNSPLAVAVTDLNGDGHPDVVVANQCTDSNCTSSTIGILLGNGDGTFQAATTYSPGGLFPDGIAIADVNGDSKLDLVIANSSTSLSVDSGNAAVLFGNGDGTFQTATAYPSGAFGAASVETADVNGDGKLDLVVVNCSATASSCVGGGGSVGVLIGNGDGTFQTVATFGSGGNTPFGVAVADLNGDNRPDIVAANCSSNACGAANGELGVLLNTSLTATATGLTSSANPSTFGQAVTFTATVAAQPGFGNGTPTGTVSFFDGATNIGSSPLNGSGVATLTTSTLPAGTDNITATYGGDTNFVGSTSPGLSQVVQGADYTLSANPTSVAVNPGSSANYTITLTPLNSYDGTVTISCPTSLPAGVTCNSPSIGSGQTQATLTVHTAGPSAALIATPDVNSHQAASNLWASLGGLGLAGMILAGDWKKRNRRRMGIVLAILAVVMILALVGCGSSSSLSHNGGGGGGGTPAGTYHLQVTGTGTAGTHQGNTTPHPVPVTLVVN